jgi:putative membrane protein
LLDDSRSNETIRRISHMRTWQSIAIAVAVATALQVHADDRANTSQNSNVTASGSPQGATMDRSSSDASSMSHDAKATASDAMAEGKSKAHDAHMAGTSAATAAEMKNISTEKFLHKAAAAGMKEVQAAELALRNSQSDDVKAFARKMISDHTKQNSQLTTLAAQNDVQVPKELSEKDKAQVEKLRTATGASFDTAYAKQMQADHAKAVTLFESCADSKNVAADVKSFCRQSVNTLQQHAQAATKLDTGMTRAASADE